MSSSSVTSSIRSIGSTPQSDSSSELTVYYASNNGGIRRAAATTVDQNNRKDRSVTFAKPLITNSREVEPFSDSFSSPILAGHPNMYPNLNGPAVCRICYSSENSGPKTGEPLISPCHCKGTMGLYHRTCLNTWLATANKSCCEICRFKFRIKRVKRSFWEYLRDEDSKAARRSLVTDILCFFLLTPLVLASSVVCALSAVHLMKEEYAERHNNNDGMGNGLHFEIAVGLLFLTAVLLIAYCIWLGITIIFHRKSLTSWQATHWNYSVADQLSLEESMLINASVGRIV